MRDKEPANIRRQDRCYVDQTFVGLEGRTTPQRGSDSPVRMLGRFDLGNLRQLNRLIVGEGFQRLRVDQVHQPLLVGNQFFRP